MSIPDRLPYEPQVSGEILRPEGTYHEHMATYISGLTVYYYGMTAAQMRRDGIVEFGVARPILDDISSFGGSKVQLTDESARSGLYGHRITLPEYLEDQKSKRPEYASILDSVVRLQQTFFAGADQTTAHGLYEQLVATVEAPLRNYDAFSWSEEEANAIKVNADIEIGTRAHQEVFDFTTAFYDSIGSIAVERTASPMAKDWAQRQALNLIIECQMLPSDQRDPATAFPLNRQPARLYHAMQKLNVRLATIPNLPRYIKDNYIDNLAVSLATDKPQITAS